VRLCPSTKFVKRRIGIFAFMAVDVIIIDYYKADCFIIVVLAIVDGIVKNAFRFKININILSAF